VRSRFFHEDDYCQQEFLPVSARDYCIAQLKEIDAFSNAHWTGSGWSEMYIRRDPPQTLQQLSLRGSDIDFAIRNALPRFGKVTTGYADAAEDAKGVRAYGEDDGVALFVETDRHDVVTALWIDPWGAGDPIELANTFASLPRAEELLFVDWARSEMFSAIDSEAWIAYFTRLANPA
jgi:hypothetical protein